MKKTLLIVGIAGLATTFTGCGLVGNIFKPKYGCKTNGKNVDAAKLVNEDPESAKAARKAKKFKS